jgi:hypothetical protein
MKLKKNKQGQVATTMTWVVATIIIVIILVISILLTAAFGKRTYNDNPSFEKTDLLVSKSLFSYLLTKESGKMIFNQIDEDSDLNEFNTLLSLKVFVDLYKNDYPNGIWFDVHGKGAESSANSLRKKYYEDYYQKTLGKKEYSYSIIAPNIDERIFFGNVPDNFNNFNTKNLVLALRK